MKILSIDDSKSVHAFITSCLDGTDHHVEHTFDGIAGIELVDKKGPQGFDVILLDWEMPNITGPEVVQKLNDKGNKIPIIMLTSKNEVKDIERMLQMGVHDYMMKPFTKDILLEKLESIF